MSTLLETTAQDMPSVLREVTALIKLADDAAFPSRTFIGIDLFEAGCAVILPEKGSTGRDEHPLGSYNIAYPYCRTALRVAVDDPDPSPLLAQVTGFARYLSARIVAMVCGVETRLAGLAVLETLPVSTQNCAVFSVVHPMTRHGFLIVDGTKVVLPTQILLQLITETGYSRSGWINVLPAEWA